ncbi:MAG: hypothetical protein JWO50_767 [Candidatus Kaiserbacteria bacterium]|nr:hypothetical protein [Candidatus Kaiserbacteria bacterium]
MRLMEDAMHAEADHRIRNYRFHMREYGMCFYPKTDVLRVRIPQKSSCRIKRRVSPDKSLVLLLDSANPNNCVGFELRNLLFLHDRYGHDACFSRPISFYLSLAHQWLDECIKRLLEDHSMEKVNSIIEKMMDISTRADRICNEHFSSIEIHPQVQEIISLSWRYYHTSSLTLH